MATRNDVKSVRWDPKDEQKFVATLRKLQAEGEVPLDIERSEAMRRVLNSWADEADPSYLR